MPTHPADLTVAESAALIAAGKLSSVELVEACLARIRERDGRHSHEGDPDSINAWVRVYEEDALASARRADARPRTQRPLLNGVPLGLKDLYAAAGKPLTASSRVLEEVPERDSDVWARLAEAGMVLLGHTHTHEFAVGGTADQVGNPWALDRAAGGSSGGSGAALAARTVAAATGTDTAGSLRIPSALCGTSTIKPTRGAVSLRGVVPLAITLDHAGPMARTLADCGALLEAMLGRPARVPEPRGGRRPLADVRLALSPRVALVDVQPDVAAGFDAALATCRRLGATVVDTPPPAVRLKIGEFLDVLTSELAAFHRRFDDRTRYRPALREWVEQGEERAVSAIEYAAAQMGRLELTAQWEDWFARERVTAILEPTVPVVAPERGPGYDHWGTDFELISLTHYWAWTGLPVVALPAGLGPKSGLPAGVSLIGPARSEAALLAAGVELQAELGVPGPPPRFA